MFSWICPQCGREVPPSYDACPDCAAKEAPGAAPPEAGQQAPPPAAAAPQQSTPPPAQPAAQAKAPAVPAAAAAQKVQYVYVKRRTPAWLVTLGVFAALLGVGALAYFYGLPYWRAHHGGESAAAPAAAGGAQEEQPAVPIANDHLTKFIEVTGFRPIEENNKTIVRYVVVNHASTELTNLEGTVTLRTKDEEVASIPFKVTSLEPYGVAEVTAPLNTGLRRTRAYEVPDWQFLIAELKLKN